MSSVIENIPLELLKKILRQARNGGAVKEFANVLTVSKKFLAAGAEYTFETIVIDYYSIETIRREVEGNPSKFSKTKALFVHFWLAWPQTTDTTAIRSRLQTYNESVLSALKAVKLCLQTQVFNSLKTFSFVINRCREKSPVTYPTTELRTILARQFSCTLDRAILKDIIAALPVTVANLEIDTNGLDRFGTKDLPAEEPHLCAQLRSILPHLQNCKLRLATLCQDFFLDSQAAVVRADYLRSLTINFTISRCDLNQRHDLTKSTCECYERITTPAVQDSSRSQDLYRPNLEGKIKLAAVNWGSIERLETVFTKYAREAMTGPTVRPFVTNDWHLRDLLTGITTIVPAYLIDRSIISRDREDKLILGPIDKMEMEIERSWLRTKDGGRYPILFFQDGEAMEMGVELMGLAEKFVDWRPYWRNRANKLVENNDVQAVADIKEQERIMNEAEMTHVMRF